MLIWLATSNLSAYINYLDKANVSLQASEERYRTLAEISPDIVILPNLTGSIAMVNQACIETLGYKTASELLGMKTWGLVDPSRQQISNR